MLILITKDGATVVPKEVATLDDAQGFANMGFVVHVETEEGRVPLVDLLAANEAGFDSVQGHRDAMLIEAAEKAAEAASARAAQKADAEKAVADAQEAFAKAEGDEDKAAAQVTLDAAQAALAELS